MGNNPPANAGATKVAGSIPASGRSPGEGNGNPLHHSCLENPMDRGAWWSLLFNMLSRLVIAFLPGSKHLLISWLQSPSSVILEPKKIQPVIIFIVSSICNGVLGPDAMIFVFFNVEL